MKSYPPEAFAKMQRAAGRMNKLEQRYREHLERRKLEREICFYAFESFKLRIGESCFYTPDFLVIAGDGRTEIHEVKGPFRREDAMVKLKAAAALFPYWRFILVEHAAAAWALTDYSAKEDRR